LPNFTQFAHVVKQSTMKAWLATLGIIVSQPAAASDPAEASVCVDALEQVLALKAMAPVYKLADHEPQFIDDADRPREIARLEKIIRSACSTNPKERGQQESAAYRLHVARSPECGQELEWLAAMEAPNSRDPKDDIARQRNFVADKCPQVKLGDRWLVFYVGSLDDQHQ
jgi:hypothetical protein